MRIYTKYNTYKEGFTQADYDQLNADYQAIYGNDDSHMGEYYDSRFWR
jgi:hypothetical protein